MAGRAKRMQSSELERARERFQAWRRERHRGERIPEDLWQIALKLVPEHGISRVVQVLRLDYYALKKRLPATSQPSDAPAFVELPTPPPTAGEECVMELEDGYRKLRISLKGYSLPDLADLSRSFWDGT